MLVFVLGLVILKILGKIFFKPLSNKGFARVKRYNKTLLVLP